MRIHSDVLGYADIHQAAQGAGATVLDLTRHDSRTREHAFNFYLTGSGLRKGGYSTSDEPAATWDEWGIVFAQLFAVDPRAHCGKHGYQCAEHFHWMTGSRFESLLPMSQHKRHRWQSRGYSMTGTYVLLECACGAVHRLLRNGNQSWVSRSASIGIDRQSFECSSVNRVSRVGRFAGQGFRVARRTQP